MSALRLELAYNACDKGRNLHGVGDGWRLNWNQHLRQETISGVRYYDAWGRPVYTNGGKTCTGSRADTLGVDNPFRYRGYVYDEETGLYSTATRYYNPEWGRFINADALLGRTGALLSHNAFAYCVNNPVNMVDSTGLEPIPWDKVERLTATEFHDQYPGSVVAAVTILPTMETFDMHLKGESTPGYHSDIVPDEVKDLRIFESYVKANAPKGLKVDWATGYPCILRMPDDRYIAASIFWVPHAGGLNRESTANGRKIGRGEGEALDCFFNAKGVSIGHSEIYYPETKRGTAISRKKGGAAADLAYAVARIMSLIQRMFK